MSIPPSFDARVCARLEANTKKKIFAHLENVCVFACLVCKWVLIDAFSPFVCLMEKHFSLNCHSQICARVCVETRERKGKTGAGHYNTV